MVVQRDVTVEEFRENFELHIFEDEGPVAKTLKKGLEKEVSVIHLHDDDDEVKYIIRDSNINKIFLVDVNLIGSTDRKGLKVIELLREQYEDSLIIALTSYVGIDILNECGKAGVNYFYEKNVSEWEKMIGNIREAIKDHIQRRHQKIKNWKSITNLYCYIKDLNPDTKKALIYCEKATDRSIRFEKIIPIEKLTKSEPLEVGKSVLITIYESNDETRVRFQKAGENYFQQEVAEDIDLSELKDSPIFNPPES